MVKLIGAQGVSFHFSPVEYRKSLREADRVAPPALTGPRTISATPAQRRVLERPVNRTPDMAELRELHAYLTRHCWRNGRPDQQCVQTSRLLLHLYGGTITGGRPDNLYICTSGNDPGSGYWYQGKWWHHLWLEQTLPGQEGVLIDLTSAQFPHPDRPEDFTVLPIGKAVRYVPTHTLGTLARGVAARKNRDTVRRWHSGWTTVHGEETR